MKLTYNPNIFSVANLEEAKRIILTPEGGLKTEERWVRETPYVAGLIAEQGRLREGMVVLDYGCGIGRLAKELIARWKVTVIGVDISRDMRVLSPVYVESPHFVPMAPEMFDAAVAAGLRIDAAFSVWVLQHCLAPADDLARIRRALRPGGPLVIVNNHVRVVPTVEKVWVNDGIDLAALIAGSFTARTRGALDAGHVGEQMAKAGYWAAFDRPADPA